MFLAILGKGIQQIFISKCPEMMYAKMIIDWSLNEASKTQDG